MKKSLLFVLLLALVCAMPLAAQDATKTSPAKPAKSRPEVATFAGGCFWCMQPPFDHAQGVLSTVVGYTGGKEASPTYEEVSAHKTSHREAIQVKFDPAKISYEQLLDIFWRNINPTQADGQFVDIGNQYRSAIYYHNDEQKRLTEESRDRLAKSGRFTKPIVTEILPASRFWPAEEYHQKYYLKEPASYHRYKNGSGRPEFLKSVWGDEAKH